MIKDDITPCTLDANGVYWLEGSFTKGTIPLYYDKIEAMFRDKTPTSVNLSNVDQCDIALVALLIKYRRDFPEIRYRNSPEVLKRLFIVYGMENIVVFE